MDEILFVTGRPVRTRKDYAIAKTFIGVLKHNRKALTEQQFRTLKGAALAGDVDGAYRGLRRILQRTADLHRYNTDIQKL